MCRIRNIIMLILIAMLALPASGYAEALHEEMYSPDLTVEAVMGYDGVMTYGKTMPARIRLENHGADMTCTVAMNVYVNRMQYNRYEMEVSLAAAATKEIVLPVFVGSKQDTFTVEVWKDGEKFCAVNTQPSKVLNPSAMLVGVLSDAPQNLSYMNIDMSTDVLLRNEYIQTVPLNAQNFPEELDLLSSFGVLMVDGFDIGLLSANQQQVLQAWLEAGHILIVGGGAQASTAWPAVSGITGLTPGELVSTAGVAPARKALVAEQKNTSKLNIFKQHDLSRQITTLTEEIEELRSEKRKPSAGSWLCRRCWRQGGAKRNHRHGGQLAQTG